MSLARIECIDRDNAARIPKNRKICYRGRRYTIDVVRNGFKHATHLPPGLDMEHLGENLAALRALSQEIGDTWLTTGSVGVQTDEAWLTSNVSNDHSLIKPETFSMSTQPDRCYKDDNLDDSISIITDPCQGCCWDHHNDGYAGHVQEYSDLRCGGSLTEHQYDRSLRVTKAFGEDHSESSQEHCRLGGSYDPIDLSTADHLADHRTKRDYVAHAHGQLYFVNHDSLRVCHPVSTCTSEGHHIIYQHFSPNENGVHFHAQERRRCDCRGDNYDSGYLSQKHYLGVYKHYPDCQQYVSAYQGGSTVVYAYNSVYHSESPNHQFNNLGDTNDDAAYD